MRECGERIFDGENALLVWREARGLSIEELAKRTNLAVAYLRKCEDGKRHLSPANEKVVAKALDIDPCELEPFPSAFGHCSLALSLVGDEGEILRTAGLQEDGTEFGQLRS
jgi:transcriptional regulator with XRE-family HTH domain